MMSSHKQNEGQVMIEFVIVVILLMIPIWYALMGGSGVWTDTEHPANNGNLPPKSGVGEPAPGFLKLLDDRQHNFSQSLNQP